MKKKKNGNGEKVARGTTGNHRALAPVPYLSPLDSCAPHHSTLLICFRSRAKKASAEERALVREGKRRIGRARSARGERGTRSEGGLYLNGKEKQFQN